MLFTNYEHPRVLKLSSGVCFDANICWNQVKKTLYSGRKGLNVLAKNDEPSPGLITQIRIEL
jgi:hypothetical protein